VAAIREARDRRAAGPTAPACGLCLTHVSYRDDK
jgi:tRNA U38,U39,U40 pseudouridine synthase TruA